MSILSYFGIWRSRYYSCSQGPELKVFSYENLSYIPGCSDSVVHLRHDNLHGVLAVNGERFLFLNDTGVLTARLILDNVADKDAVRIICHHYKVSKEQARADFLTAKQEITSFLANKPAKNNEATPPTPLIDFIPVDIPETSKKDKSDKKRLDIFSIPFRSDLALWYRCNNRCPHCYLEDKREKKSLTIKEWRKVIEKLYASGIFHLTITGGEPSIYPELKDIIACSRKAGHLTGLISNGRMLGRDGVAESLKQAGLHHVQITLLGQCAETHDSLTGIEGSYEETIRGIRNSIEAGLWTITNTTITKKNIKTAEDICQFIEYLHSLKLRTFAMNTIIVSGKGKDFEHTYSFKELKDILAAAKAKADELKMKFIWYSPTPYCELNPVELGLGVKRCSAAEGAIAVEPDGTVLPCQSCFIPLGNILEKPLEEILLHPVAVRIRERLWVEQRCRDCSNFADCGGGCPLERNAVSRLWDGNEKE